MPLAVEEQLTMRELLKDPIYKQWLKKMPSIGAAICPSGKPWRVWVQKRQGGNWARGDFETYRQAYDFMRWHLGLGVHDVALTCKIKEFRPPVVTDKSLPKRVIKVKGGPDRFVWRKRYHIPAQIGQNPLHEWCTYCRRPTIFTYFTRHHSHPQRVNGNERRCAICGIRLVAVRHYR